MNVRPITTRSMVCDSFGDTSHCEPVLTLRDRPRRLVVIIIVVRCPPTFAAVAVWPEEATSIHHTAYNSTDSTALPDRSVVVYQPTIDIGSVAVWKSNAQLRWLHCMFRRRSMNIASSTLGEFSLCVPILAVDPFMTRCYAAHGVSVSLSSPFASPSVLWRCLLLQ